MSSQEAALLGLAARAPPADRRPAPAAAGARRARARRRRRGAGARARSMTSSAQASAMRATSSSATSCSASSLLSERSSSALVSASSRTRACAASLARRAACSTSSTRCSSRSCATRSVMSRAMTAMRVVQLAAQPPAGHLDRHARAVGAQDLGAKRLGRLAPVADAGEAPAHAAMHVGRHRGEDRRQRVQLLRAAPGEDLGRGVDVDHALALEQHEGQAELALGAHERLVEVALLAQGLAPPRRARSRRRR